MSGGMLLKLCLKKRALREVDDVNFFHKSAERCCWTVRKLYDVGLYSPCYDYPAD